MLNKIGPFLGFTYNGTHSSEFNIVRVVNNNRMQNDLLPESADITQNVEGADGTLYYGTTYKKKEFTVNFAFDNMEEKNRKDMQAWLGDGEVHDLIFDEDEYNEDGTKELNPITYSAKVTGKATLSFIPFDKQGKTIYKGEGSIVFTCYYPFGRKKVVIENPGDEVTITNRGVRPIYPCFDGWISAVGNNHIRISKGTHYIDILPTFKGSNSATAITINFEKFLITDGSGNILNGDIKEGDFFPLGVASGGQKLYITAENGASIDTITYYELYY